MVILTCATLWTAADAEDPGWFWWGMRWPVLGLALCTWLFCGVRKRGLRVAALVACPLYLIGAALGQPISQCRPHVLQEDQLMIREAAHWIKSRRLETRRVVTANIWIDEFLGFVRSPVRWRTREALAAMKPGDLFVWDARYCPQPPHQITLDEVRRSDDLVELWHGGEHSRDGIYCYVFEKR